MLLVPHFETSPLDSTLAASGSILAWSLSLKEKRAAYPFSLRKDPFTESLNNVGWEGRGFHAGEKTLLFYLRVYEVGSNSEAVFGRRGGE